MWEWIFGHFKTEEEQRRETEKKLRKEKHRLEREEEEAIDDAEARHTQAENALFHGKQAQAKAMVRESLLAAKRAETFSSTRSEVENVRAMSIVQGTREQVLDATAGVNAMAMRTLRREEAREARRHEAGVPGHAQAVKKFNEHFQHAQQALTTIRTADEQAAALTVSEPEVDAKFAELMDIITLDEEETILELQSIKQHHNKIPSTRKMTLSGRSKK